MNLFDKRPLSLILCIILGGFVVFSFFGENFRIAFCLISFLTIPFPFVFKRLSKFKVIVPIIFSAIVLSSAFSYFYFDCYFEAKELVGKNVFVEGEITSLKYSSNFSGTAVVDAKKISDSEHEYKLQVRISGEDINKVLVGDTISFYAKIEAFNDNGSFDVKRYCYSRGISAQATDLDNLMILERCDDSLPQKLDKQREVFRRESALLSNLDTGTLLGALLTGERGQLSDELQLDFLRIGITHILALSGMHLAILSVAVQRILKIFGFSRKTRTFLSLIFVILYMGFVGFSVSVVRAGIMLIISSFLYFINEPHDSITSLCIAVLIIVLITPYAIYDVALWLSAFATLGVIVAADRQEVNMHKSIPIRIIRIVADSIYASILANGATLAISVFSFGGFSLLSPLSTLMFSFIIELFMYLGCLMYILSFIYKPFALKLGQLLIHLYEVIYNMSAFFSSNDLVYVIANEKMILTSIIIFTVIFFALLIVKLNKRVVSAIILILFFGIFITAGYSQSKQFNTDELIYMQQQKSDVFLIKSGKKNALISSSQYSSGLAYDSVDFLKENNITVLDIYIVTHYAFSLEDDFTTLLSSVLIKEISLPFPRNDDEMMLYKKFLNFIENYRVELTLHNAGGQIKIGRFNYFPLYSLPYGDGSSTNAALITYNDTEKYLYLSSGMIDKKLTDIYSDAINDADTIIFGSHGKKYKSQIYIKDLYENANIILLSSENLFFNQFSYIKYIENGCKIISHPRKYQLIYMKLEDSNVKH